MTDLGRETRAYVSAFDRTRVHQSRLYRFEKRRLVANFRALLGERQIRCATWRIDCPEIGVISDPQISDDAVETSVMFAAQLGGRATVRCEISLESGEKYNQVYRIQVREASWFPDDPPLETGPFSVSICREDPPPPPPSGNSFQFSAGRMSGDFLQFCGYSDGTFWPGGLGEIEDGQAAFAGHEVYYLLHNRFPEPEYNEIYLALKGNPPPPDGLFSAIKITVDNNEFVLNASEASYEAYEEDAFAEWFWLVGVDIFQQFDSVLVEFIAETES